MNKLPVFKSVGEVFRGVTRHYFQLLLAAWPAIVFLAAVQLFADWGLTAMGYTDESLAAAQMPEGRTQEQFLEWIVRAWPALLMFAAVVALFLLAGAVAAVRWHRFVLLGEGAGQAGSAVKALRVEDGTYIWTAIRIWALALLAVLAAGGLLLLLTTGPLVLFAIPIIVFGVIWANVAFLRMSLALPDAAIGRGGRIKLVFAASAGNGMRLLGFSILLSLVCLIPLLAMGIVEAVFQLFLAQREIGDTWAISLISAVLTGAIYLYFLMLQITMLSVAYREVVGLPGAPSAELGPEPAPAL